MMNSTAKKHRQYDIIDDTPYDSYARNNFTVGNNRQAQQERNDTNGAQYMTGITGTAPRRHNLKFDEEEELISAFREYIRLELEMDDSKTRLAM